MTTASRDEMLDELVAIADAMPTAVRAVLVEDFDGRLSLFLDRFRNEAVSSVTELTKRVPEWTGPLALSLDPESADGLVFEAVWEEATETKSARVRLLVRRSGHGEWFRLENSLWQGPPYTAAFYSFKGGVGRTTALLGFAIQATRLGNSVLLIDSDLDSPGLYAVFQDRRDSPTADLGLVDYLVEVRAERDPNVNDYVSRHQLSDGAADCFLMHGGAVNSSYLDKLSRADTTVLGAERYAGFKRLMMELRDAFQPDWIILDTRSGLSDSAALATSGLFNLVVAVSTDTAQNWLGLSLIVEHLGNTRVKVGREQQDCLLVQALVPARESEYSSATEAFQAHAQEVFEDKYYVADGQDEGGKYLTVSDAGGSDSPDKPVHIRVSDRLSQYDRLSFVADDLLRDRDYEAMTARMLERYASTNVTASDGP